MYRLYTCTYCTCIYMYILYMYIHVHMIIHSFCTYKVNYKIHPHRRYIGGSSLCMKDLFPVQFLEERMGFGLL